MTNCNSKEELNVVRIKPVYVKSIIINKKLDRVNNLYDQMIILTCTAFKSLSNQFKFMKRTFL
jgi:hypothetical protein